MESFSPPQKNPKKYRLVCFQLSGLGRLRSGSGRLAQPTLILYSVIVSGSSLVFNWFWGVPETPKPKPEPFTFKGGSSEALPSSKGEGPEV